MQKHYNKVLILCTNFQVFSTLPTMPLWLVVALILGGLTSAQNNDNTEVEQEQEQEQGEAEDDGEKCTFWLNCVFYNFRSIECTGFTI